MNCKKCGHPINLHIFGMPEDICFGCYDNKDEIVEKNIKVKTQPMGCPCCEAAVDVIFNSDILRTGDKFYKICCSECSIQTGNFKTEYEVIEVWNVRPNHNKMFRTFAV